MGASQSACRLFLGFVDGGFEFLFNVREGVLSHVVDLAAFPGVSSSFAGLGSSGGSQVQLRELTSNALL